MSQPAASSKMKKSPSMTDSHHLFDAVVKGKIHLTRFILAASSSQIQNAWDEQGRTPLIACCDIKEEGTRDQIVHILLEGGSDVNMTDREGRSALIHACEKRCNDIVRILVHHHNIKPDIEDIYGNTALIYAAAIGNDVATELLTRNFRRLGLMVDHYNKQGNTAIQVATKNGNLNCAKILAQKGRASVLLKDRDNGLTPLEWCLREGYSKEEVDFLKPNARFYRVAKLATSLSLSRSRSSVASLSHDTPRPKVASSKSVDSCMEVKVKDHSKIALTRSKSQIVGCRPCPEGSAVIRQTTIDTCVSPLPSVSDETAGNPEAYNYDFQRSPNPELSPVFAESAKERNAKSGSGSRRDKAGAGSSKNSHEGNRKFFPPDDAAYSGALPDSVGEPYSANSRCGHVTGLGCALSTISMTTTTTSLSSCDSRTDSAGANSNNTPDKRSSSKRKGKSNHATKRDGEVAGCYGSSGGASVSDRISSLQHGSKTSSRSGRAGSQADTAGSASDRHPDSQGHGSSKSGHSHRQCEQTVGTKTTDYSSSSSSRQSQKNRFTESSTAAECGADLVQTSASSTLMQGAEYSSVDAETNQFSDAGHNVLSFVSSAAVSINNFDSQTSASGQEPRMVAQVCNSPQISQDA